MSGETSSPRFLVWPALAKSQQTTIEIPDGNHCGYAVSLGNALLATTDDCESTGHGIMFGFDGHRIAQVGGDANPLNTYGAYSIPLHEKHWAIVAPAAYSIVVLDDRIRQTIVDLVPIQARATESPAFTLVETADSGDLVASPTGGVGVIDPIAAKLTASWIIPECASAP
jgi:hypothetical protein